LKEEIKLKQSHFNRDYDQRRFDEPITLPPEKLSSSKPPVALMAELLKKFKDFSPPPPLSELFPELLIP